MLYLTEYDQNKNYRTLALEKGGVLFHKALRAVLNGERRFHVKKSFWEHLTGLITFSLSA